MEASSLFSVKGKVAVVTGGGSGIGLMIAEGLLCNGAARVYLCSRKNAAAAAAAASLSGAVAITADLSTAAGVEALAQELVSREPAIHILVNNSGANWNESLESFPTEAFQRVTFLNLHVPFLLSRALLPLLEAGAAPSDCARIINIGSVDGMQPPAMSTYAYAASKAGLHHLSRMLAAELGSRHITVNTIAPGPFMSKMMKATLEAAGDAVAKSTALGRIGAPEEIAGAALFLASKAGGYCTGSVLVIDGGLTALAGRARL
ncbi:hypothetical protein AB1Y20_000866 [Prymnesium parvum]|uniref:Rhamnolipids biosynthesis 3-oxoacyl-[acyl-carrier-protein] reductase n=1 Tax=Prymnesium parvum TaxID=97485 RepID=A0AB34K614_PRYPA